MSMLKSAYGQDNEAEFEQAFSSLAYSHLKNKAPKLLDSLVGFQLVDRNEDDTKAFAVFGFKVGNQWLYAPVFFLNGDLKGHELLYLKNNDSFVPMSEKWVNYILSRKPHILGEASAKNLQDLGGRYPNLHSLTRMSISQLAKRANDNSWIQDFLPVAKAFKDNHTSSLYRNAPSGTLKQAAITGEPWTAALAQVAENLDLGQILSSNPVLLDSAAKLAAVVPQVKQGFDKFYGKDCFRHWAAKFVQEKEAASTDLFAGLSPVNTKKAAVRLYTYEQIIISPAAELDDEDLSTLQQEKILIKDERTDEQRSIVYSVDAPLEMVNPTCCGLYNVLMPDGSFEKMLVLLNPISNANTYRCAIVIKSPSSAGDKDYGVIARDKVFVRQAETTDTDCADWFAELKDSELEEGATYVAVGPHGQCTSLFEVKQEGMHNFTATFLYIGYEFQSGSCDKSDYGVKIIRNKDKSFWSRDKFFGIPESFKCIKICSCDRKADDPIAVGMTRDTVVTGSLDDVRDIMAVKTASLRVTSDGLTVHIRSPKGALSGSKTDALWHLVEKQAMTEELARDILREADRKRKVEYRIEYPQTEKSAAPNNSVLAGGPNAELLFSALDPQSSENYGPRTSAMVQNGGELNYRLQELMAGNNDPSRWDNWRNFEAEDFQKTTEQMTQAVASGQKEIFDVSALSTMLRSVRNDSLAEQYLGSLMDAIDSLGRLLMNFYWHEEDFADRYGQSDMPELEDGLRNAFETLGDITLFLKEKTIESPMDIGEINLDDIAGN